MTSSTSEPAPARMDAGHGCSTYVLLQVANAVYAVDVEWALGVVPVSPVTRVPGAGPAIRGVINVRGRVLPLADLAVAVEGVEASRASGREDPPTALLMATPGADVPELAALAQVLDIVELDAGSLEPPPAFGLGAAAALVAGVLRRPGGGLAMVLDPDRLWASVGVQRTDS